MKKTLEALWQDCFLEKCAIVDSDEERNLTKKAIELRERVNETLNEEQAAAVDRYLDALCQIDALFIKKAFVTGCEFAVSFLFEAKS